MGCRGSRGRWRAPKPSLAWGEICRGGLRIVGAIKGPGHVFQENPLGSVYRPVFHEGALEMACLRFLVRTVEGLYSELYHDFVGLCYG